MTEYDPGIRHEPSIFVRVPVIFARATFYFFSYSNSSWTFLVFHSSSNNWATVEDAFFSTFRDDNDPFDGLILNTWRTRFSVCRCFLTDAVTHWNLTFNLTYSNLARACLKILKQLACIEFFQFSHIESLLLEWTVRIS